jgi:hypothetical protein
MRHSDENRKMEQPLGPPAFGEADNDRRRCLSFLRSVKTYDHQVL